MRAELRARWVIACLGLGCSPFCSPNRLSSHYEAVSTIEEHGQPTRANLVIQFKQLLRWNWKVQLFHIYCKGNCLADYISGRRHGLPLGTHFVTVSDPVVTNLDGLRSFEIVPT
ncbi:hypothetical protein LINGRAHAP2_LOCUS36047 [Linum grandiflorum]